MIEDIKPEVINIDYLFNKEYKTKDGQSISFKFSTLNQDIDQDNLIASMKTFHIIEAFVGEEQAGYLLLGHIDLEKQQQYLPTYLDWLIHSYANKSIKDQWHNGNKDNCIAFFNNIVQQYNNYKNKELSLKEIEFTLNKSENNNFKNNYLAFINYWINKPNEELVCVYSSQDFKHKSFETFPFLNQKRKQLNNFRGQGIAQSLYEVAGIWMQSKNMNIYSSYTKTEDGKKLWSILETLPQFKIFIESHKTTLTNNRKDIIEKPRKKIVIK